MDIERPSFVEGAAGLTLVAGIVSRGGIQAVDGLGKDTCAGSLTDAARSAEEISMRQMVLTDSILQSLRECFLPDHALKVERTVFASRYDIVFHR